MFTTTMPASTAFFTTGTSAFESAGASTIASTFDTIICSRMRIWFAVSVSSLMPLVIRSNWPALCFWYSFAPVSIVRKNSLASDFITSATFGLAADCAWTAGAAATATAASAAVRKRRRKRTFILISWRPAPKDRTIV